MEKNLKLCIGSNSAPYTHRLKAQPLSLSVVAVLEDKKDNNKKHIYLLLAFYAQHGWAYMEHTLGQLRSITPAVPLPSLFSTQASSMWGKRKTRTRPWCQNSGMLPTVIQPLIQNTASVCCGTGLLWKTLMSFQPDLVVHFTKWREDVLFV